MSIRKIEKNDFDGNSQEGSIVTDSVHERLRQPIVYCPSCQENFSANNDTIKRHFELPHESAERCVYCHGQVFKYVSFHFDNDGNKISKDETYHSCREGGLGRGNDIPQSGQ